MPPASGRLLVAAPLLTEETFSRTVVYLLEHDGGGSVGVVVNRPSHTPVGHVLPDWQDAVAEPGVVFSGGPVQQDGALCLGLASEVPAERPGQQGLFPDSGGLRPVADGVRVAPFAFVLSFGQAIYVPSVAPVPVLPTEQVEVPDQTP